MSVDHHELPPAARRIAGGQPAIWQAYDALGRACADAGPLDEPTRRLVKLALAVGAGLEGAVHSHVRRGLADGLSPEQLKHVALLAIPTLGFPAASRALTWIEDFTDPPAG
jgi:alkylhydroperoxidase/carboxymuconolactone decarboxylase family protein YurZ